MLNMSTKSIVQELNRFIISQDDAKKYVAIALRNRWRRMQLKNPMKQEVTPKNILMVGPTGVGKTEIARRLAKLTNAPFIKVEATKFTEVGYVGKDVESIIRDLTDISVKMHKEQEIKKVQKKAQIIAKKKILDILLPKSQEQSDKVDDDNNKTKKFFEDQINSGELNEKEIEIEIQIKNPKMEIMGPPGMEEMTSQLQSIFSNINNTKKKLKTLKIKDALKLIEHEESQKLINEDNIKFQAIKAVEENGIIFLDEIDKICKKFNQNSSNDISREGVQRDLLPIIEGSSVNTKYGIIKTNHILFIASGSFHMSKESDLIPELQGRLPIRVKLKSLSINDLIAILEKTDFSIIKQYIALMNTESIEIIFEKEAIKKIAEISFYLNNEKENIGARRLHTVIEKLLDDISFNSDKFKNTTQIINVEYVNKQLNPLMKKQNLNKYIL